MVTMEDALWTIGEGPWTCILDHALADYPYEACGILLCPSERPRCITTAYPVENATSEDSTTRYFVAPADLLAVQKWAEARELDICGFYHSHPDCPSVPSEYDRQSAWEGYLYLILSVKDGVFERSGAWRWDPEKGQFEAVILRSRPHRRRAETSPHSEDSVQSDSMD